VDPDLNGFRVRFWLRAADWDGQSVNALSERSDVDLLGDGERAIDFDAEVSDSAVGGGVPKEKLNCVMVPGPPVNQRRLGSPQRVGAE
jgi:hypothetical protein